MILIFILIFLLFGILFNFFFDSLKDRNAIHLVGLFISSVLFLFSLVLFFNYDFLNINFQYFYFFEWLSFLGIYYVIGLDGISLLFIVLTTFLIFISIFFSLNQYSYSIRELILLLFLLEFFLINFFIVLDFFFFFVFFEAVLIPMFLIIGSFGSRERRIHATFQFFIFTMFGSFFMLVAFILIYLHQGNSDIQTFYQSIFNYDLEIVLWVFIFFSLAIKIPLFPVHIWLPEAHVEAPTVGSVILAGILLKMGSYGMFRFLIPSFTFSSKFFFPFLFILSFLSIYYISLITICQIDLKKLIAYSSIAHMGFVTLSLFTYNIQGLSGSIFLMISHGIVSGLLFLLIGILYDRYKTRVIFFYQSLNSIMPMFCFTFFIASLANVGFPGTISFIGEFLILLSFLEFNKFAFFFHSLAFFFSAIYSFWLYNRIAGGSIFLFFRFGDFSLREAVTVFPFILLIFLLGLQPNLILDYIELINYTIILTNET
jgi:proton-translocating NADH-quinone oxidoreductase chain M